MLITLVSILTLSILGLIAGLGLAYASQKFEVKVDPRIEEVLRVLPGSNCGACGWPSCRKLAEDIVAGKAEPGTCPMIGKPEVEMIAWIMGVEAKIAELPIAVIRCGAGQDLCQERFEYQGVKTCAAAHLLSQGSKACLYGCLGFGDCQRVCPVEAIAVSDQGLALVDLEKCIGCGKCLKACPRPNLIKLSLKKTAYFILCNSSDKGPLVRKNCKVGCIACGICIRECPFEAIKMENNLAEIDQEKCTHCGQCVTVCPPKTIVKF